MVYRAIALLLLALFFAGCSKSPEKRLASHKAKAAAYAKEGKIDEAILELRSALGIAPKDKEALRQIGEMHFRKGKLREAFQAVRELSELDPKDLGAQVRLGNLYLMANSVAEAKRRADAALAADANRPDAHMLLGQIHLRERRPEDALSEFDRAIALEPSNLENSFVKATTLYGLRRLGEARKVVEDILAKSSENPAALLLLAQIADLQKDQPTVEGTFARLLKAAPDSPSVWLNYGNLWLSRGDTAKAAEAFRKAGEVDRQGTAGWEKLAELGLERRDLGKAREAVQAIFARNPKSLVGTFYEGRALLEERKFDDAISRLQNLIKQRPDFVEPYFYLGLAQYGQKNLSVAKATLQKALELQPRFDKARLLFGEVLLELRDYANAYKEMEKLAKGPKVYGEAALIRASALMGQGKVPEARKMLETVVKEVPKLPRAHERLGLCYLAEKNFKAALAAFDNALASDPKNLRPLVLTTQVLTSQKKVDQAIARVSAHIRGAGDSAQARELLGSLYLAKRDHGRARQELEQAIKLDPNASEAYVLLAQMQPFPKGVRDALDDLDKALAKQPRYLQAWMMKGALHDILRQPAEAEKAYRKALEVKPDLAPALNELAWNLAENGGNIDEALKFAEKAVEVAPKAAPLNDTLGWIYVKKGVYLKGLTHLESAVETMSGNPVVQYHLGKAYAGLGEKKKAVASLKKALGLAKKFPGSDDAAKTLRELEAKKG